MPLQFEHRPCTKPAHPDFEKPRLWVDDFISQMPYPTTADWCTRVTDWPMALNGPDPTDPGAPILGTCGIAGMNNLQIAENTYGGNVVRPWPNPTILSLYEQLGHYVPGDPTTDNGTILQDNLAFWRHNPIEGQEILAFGALKPGSWLRPERLQALQAFGPLYLGMNLPQSAEQQFPGPWEYVPGSPSVGGHCVLCAAEFHGMDELRLPTWHTAVAANTRFLLSTVTEAWVVITAAGIERNGANQYGVNLDGMNTVLAQLTGQSNVLGLKTIL